MNLDELQKFHISIEKGNLPFIIKFPIIFISAWTFQGMLQMDKTEKLFKIFLEIIFFIPLLIIFNRFPFFLLNILISILIAHSLNFIFNGQIFAMLKNFHIIYTDNDIFMRYIENLKKRLNKNNSIVFVAVYGSFTRGHHKVTSDLDVRMIRKNGFFNALNSCFFVLFERSKAFLNRFPLDIYLYDNFKKLSTLKEEPTIIYDPENYSITFDKKVVENN